MVKLCGANYGPASGRKWQQKKCQACDRVTSRLTDYSIASAPSSMLVSIPLPYQMYSINYLYQFVYNQLVKPSLFSHLILVQWATVIIWFLLLSCDISVWPINIHIFYLYLVPSAVLDPRIGCFVDNLPPLSWLTCGISSKTVKTLWNCTYKCVHKCHWSLEHTIWVFRYSSKILSAIS